MNETDKLKERLLSLLEQLASVADEIKRIDNRLAILKSIDLETDLFQAGEKAKA